MWKNNDLLLVCALIVLICSMARYNGRLHCIVGSYPPATSAKQPPISTPRWHGHGLLDVDFTFDSMTFVLVVILQSFVLYCVDASFISGRAMNCTIFENVISG